MNSPIRLIASLDSAAKWEGMDKAMFLAEYEAWKEDRKKVAIMFEIKLKAHRRLGMI